MRYRDHELTKALSDAPKLLYLGSALRTLGCGLLGSFGVIYIFQLFLKYGFGETQAFTLTIIVNALVYGVKFYTIFPVIYLVKKLGVKSTLVIGTGLSSLSMCVMAMAGNSIFWLIAHIIVIGLLINVYWISFHMAFISRNKEHSFGKQLGIISTLNSILGISTPLISGFILTKLGGFNVLFAISFGVFALASLAFFNFNPETKIVDFSFAKFFMILKKQRFLVPDFIVIGAENFIQDIVWVIFIFLFIKSYMGLGVLLSIISLIIAAISFFIGKLSDERKMVGGFDKLSAFFNGAVWFGRIFAQNGAHVFFLDSLFGLFRMGYEMPIDVVAYDFAKENDPIYSIILREFTLDIGRMIAGIFTAVIIASRYEYWIVFLVASIGYMVLGLLLRDNYKSEES